MAALFPADTYLFRQYVKYVQKNYKEHKAYFRLGVEVEKVNAGWSANYSFFSGSVIVVSRQGRAGRIFWILD